MNGNGVYTGKVAGQLATSSGSNAINSETTIEEVDLGETSIGTLPDYGEITPDQIDFSKIAISADRVNSGEFVKVYAGCYGDEGTLTYEHHPEYGEDIYLICENGTAMGWTTAEALGLNKTNYDSEKEKEDETSFDSDSSGSTVVSDSSGSTLEQDPLNARDWDFNEMETELHYGYGRDISRDAFNAYDKDGDGVLSKEEHDSYISNFGTTENTYNQTVETSTSTTQASGGSSYGYKADATFHSFVSGGGGFSGSCYFL